ncbi:MAG: signal peptidase I [Oscillospiraceae bacterium]|nr:signal peptidase I [Oscillospiraceae bacterium]
MRRKPQLWETELDELAGDLSALIDTAEAGDARELAAYLDAVEPMLRTVTGPGWLTRALRVFSFALNIMVFIVCAGIMTGAIIFSSSKNPGKSFFGLHFYNVLSESMTPTQQLDGSRPKGGFYKGDAIVVKTQTAEKIKVGQIITFWRNPAQKGLEDPWTHRVVEIIPPDGSDTSAVAFVTKGDYNNSVDYPPVQGNDVIGVKLFSLPMLGRVLGFAQRHLALTILFCVLISAGIFVLFLWVLKLSSRRRRRHRKI